MPGDKLKVTLNADAELLSLREEFLEPCKSVRVWIHRYDKLFAVLEVIQDGSQTRNAIS